MGLWEFLQQWSRGRVVVGVVASLLIHVLVAGGLLWGLAPELAPKWTPKPGDALIVELPKPDEPASAGSPSAPPPPAGSPAPLERKAVTPAPRCETPPPPREERRVASAPRAPEPAPPAPRAPEPLPTPAEPAPRVTEPAPPVTEPAPRAAEPAPRAADPAPPAPAPAAPGPAPQVPVAPTEPRPQGGERQVASLPPGGPAGPSASDVRAALRRGAGGRGQGRGGIEGDPIPLDSDDARFSEYLEQVRRRIKENWGYPCVRNAVTRECKVHETSLLVDFGILKDGRVQFVEVVRMADHALYDEYAVNAIKLASPFPPVPAAIMRTRPAGSTGFPIRVHFIYVVASSLTNLLR